MIVPRHYENLHVLHENTLPERSYYIPASGVMHNLVEHREASDRFRLTRLMFHKIIRAALIYVILCITDVQMRRKPRSILRV